MNPSILKELQHLVAANVISEETAASIQEYYRSRKAEPSNRFTNVLGILGALLVGLGIVLVIAHNWDSLSRTIKTIVAFLPLVLGQGLCLYTLLKRKDNFVWRESSAIILFFGIGASISLVSQIYHMGGELTDLLLVWMLLAAPLIYVIPSYIVSLLYIAGVSWYACIIGYAGYSWTDDSDFPYLYLPLMLAVVPAYLKLLRAQNNLLHLHNWLIAVSLAFVLGGFARYADFQWVFLGYLLLACIYYLIGTGKFFEGRGLYANPFLVLAVPGIICTLLPWTYQSLWQFDIFGDTRLWDEIFIYIIVLFILVIAAILIRRYTNKERTGISPVEFSGYVFQVAILLETQYGMLSATVVNLWVLTLGLYFIRKGSMRHHLGILNLGLLIVAALAVLRFFDEDIPFVWRGIFFLVAGIGFFVANYLVIKRKRSLAIMKDHQL
jgi:uncharacterized membrane protein